MKLVDRTAATLAVLAVFAALAIFFAVAADPARLVGFAPEQLVLFSIVDSTPQRRALLAFLALLLLAALALRFAGAARPAAVPRDLLVVAFAAALVVQFATWPPLADADPIRAAAIFLAYAAAAALVIAHSHLPRALLAAAIAAIIALAWWPLREGAMRRISAPMMPWVDQHLAAVYSGGEMLAQGFALFTETPTSYGILAPILLGALAHAGLTIDLVRLVHLTEACQAALLCLFLLACWARTRGLPDKGRLAALLLIAALAYPFLSMASQAVFLPNQSGFRFFFFPLAALCLLRFGRDPLIRTTALAGALCTLALLHNTETGIAVTAGLGLAWLVTVRIGAESSATAPNATAANPEAISPRTAQAGLRTTTRPASLAEAVRALLAGLAGAALILAATLLFHRLALGAWPSLDLTSGMSLFRRFGEGFGGLAPSLRLTALFILAHAGTVVICALAALAGRPGLAPSPATAGLALMILAWAPYFANRPHDWNLWSYLLLEVLLLAPVIAAGLPRLALALVVAILLLPAPPMEALRSDGYRRAMAAMPVTKRCGAGLHLPPIACAEQHARAAELRAAPPDTLWITAYPFLTWQMTRRRPFLPPLDLYAAAITEADLASLAARIAAARPAAILIDGAAGTSIGDAVPGPMRALHRRIATAAGYAPCRASRFWERWSLPGHC